MSPRVALTKIRDCYVLFLLFGIWSGICIAIGAAWMWLAIVAVLKSHGIDVL